MEIKKSSRDDKKYMAIFNNGKTAHFGSSSYQHYKDQTPVKAYSELDHGDSERRRAYWARHGGGAKTKTAALAHARRKYGADTPAYLSIKWLW